jgi:hypothetical protein
VTLSMTYNDSYSSTQLDLHDAFERTIDRNPFARVFSNAASRAAIRSARTELTRALAMFGQGQSTATEIWRGLGHHEDPPEPVARFERALRRIGAIVRERGARFVLMKEPLRGDQRMIWKDEFRAAIDRVATDFGGFVVDPTPALMNSHGPKLFQDDVHPTATGNEIITTALIPVVARALDAR